MDMISVVINLDTRDGFDGQVTQQGAMFNGTRSVDFIVDGTLNKIKFFEGFEFEIILHIDVHNPVPVAVQNKLAEMMASNQIASIVYSNHRKYFWNQDFCHKFNDVNYLNALAQARGKYICHFDGDMAAYANGQTAMKRWLQWLDEGKYQYISYPSLFSPNAVHDPSFDYVWASTRFFLCKRDIFDYTEFLKCVLDSDYLYGKYGDKSRRCPWLEHVLGITSNSSVFYPKIDMNEALIFTWSKYKQGTYAALHNRSYFDVAAYVVKCGGIRYPVDVVAQ